MALVYLALGSNLGNKTKNFESCIEALSVEVGRVVLVSSFILSEPWGFESENVFLNAVLLVDTHLSPADLLAKTQEIELDLGRKHKSGGSYADRLIDIDILLYDDRIVDEEKLKIPHPLMTERDFVLIPLVEIAPELKQPSSGKLFSDYLLDLEKNR